MFDISNIQLITTKTVPGDMTDTKEVFLTETPIPGLNYSPIQHGGNGNRKITHGIFPIPSYIAGSIIFKQMGLAELRQHG